MEAWVSTKRVNAFLQLDELNYVDYYDKTLSATNQPRNTVREKDNAVSSPAEANSAKVSQYSTIHISSPHDASVPGQYTVSIRHGSFTWIRVLNSGSQIMNQEEQSPDTTVPWSLRDVNITIEPVSAAVRCERHCGACECSCHHWSL